MNNKTISDCSFSLATASDVQSITAELARRYKLHHFSFVRRFADFSHILLSTSADWQEHYYKNQLYTVDDLQDHPSKYKHGFALFSSFITQDVFSQTKDFGFDHGVTFIEPNSNYCDFFYFATTPDNQAVLNFYLNNIE